MTMRVLFVDDEPAVLSSLRRLLRQSRRDWDVHFAAGGHEALDMMASHELDAVVSDAQMPGMDGATLLERTKELHPTVARIMLSGEVKTETALRVAAAAHQFLAKPCPAEQLCAVIERVSSLRRILMDPTALAAVAGIGALPSPPGNLVRLNQMLRDEDATMDDIAGAIAEDVAITTKMLQVVNSSFFGVRTHITTISRATGMLGQRTIQALAAASGIMRAYEGASSSFVAALEHHSTTVARIAAEHAPPELREALFASALLHDVGWLVLADGAPARFRDFLKRYPDSPGGDGLEREFFGATHDEIGAALLALWGLPEETIEAAAWNVGPATIEGRIATYIAKAHQLLPADAALEIEEGRRA